MKFSTKNASWVYITHSSISWIALMNNNVFISPFTEDGVANNEYIVYKIIPGMLIMPLSADAIQEVHNLMDMHKFK
jgi:hypothetical protein